MSLLAGAEEVLLTKGWRKSTDGPHLAAWKLFWGKDLELDVLQPSKAWRNS